MSPETDIDENKAWYNEKGQFHRKDGPAIEFANGDKYWYINGKLHRLNGAAEEWIDGNKFWYYHGKRIFCSTQEEFERIIKLRIFW